MKSTLIIAIASLSLAACTSLFPPTTEETAALPTVRFGQKAPEVKDFILLYPAGQPLPMAVSISGNIFERNEQTTLNPRLKRDIHVYKHWASYDGKTWLKGSQLIGGNIELRLPGETKAHEPGSLAVEFHEKLAP